MKYIISLFGIIIVCCGFFFCSNKEKEQYFRLHITANSNLSVDEQAKYCVKDAVTDYLEFLLKDVKNKDEAKQKIADNLLKLEVVVYDVLNKMNLTYGAKIEITHEKIPLRVYDNAAVKEGYYDCLNIELGNARGDNWWCVVYPTMCYSK